MSEVNEYVEAELENIERLVKELPAEKSLESLSGLELSGTAAILHGFYNGLENVLKQLVRYRELQIPEGPSWHRDLIAAAVSNGIISEGTAEVLKGYLAFRHFFSHAYAFDLDSERIVPLVRHISHALAAFRKDIQKSLLERKS